MGWSRGAALGILAIPEEDGAVGWEARWATDKMKTQQQSCPTASAKMLGCVGVWGQGERGLGLACRGWQQGLVDRAQLRQRL